MRKILFEFIDAKAAELEFPSLVLQELCLLGIVKPLGLGTGLGPGIGMRIGMGNGNGKVPPHLGACWDRGPDLDLDQGLTI